MPWRLGPTWSEMPLSPPTVAVPVTNVGHVSVIGGRMGSTPLLPPELGLPAMPVPPEPVGVPAEPPLFVGAPPFPVGAPPLLVEPPLPPGEPSNTAETAVTTAGSR